jgi:hypothetical protein
MTEYTNEIRAAYVEYAESADFPTQKHYLEWKEAGGAEAEFDRMIAAVERAAAVKALDSVWDIVYDEERYARDPNYVMHSSEVFAAINEVRGYVAEARADRIESGGQA